MRRSSSWITERNPVVPPLNSVYCCLCKQRRPGDVLEVTRRAICADYRVKNYSARNTRRFSRRWNLRLSLGRPVISLASPRQLGFDRAQSLLQMAQWKSATIAVKGRATQTRKAQFLILVVSSNFPTAERRDIDASHYHGIIVVSRKRVAVELLCERGDYVSGVHSRHYLPFLTMSSDIGQRSARVR